MVVVKKEERNECRWQRFFICYYVHINFSNWIKTFEPYKSADVLLSKTKFESADSVGDNENYNKENENDNITHRPLIELSRNDILGLLDSMPQYKSTFSISKVTGSVLSNCSSVKVLFFILFILRYSLIFFSYFT